MRMRNVLRGALAASLVALLMSSVQSSQADDPEWYPGLPDTTFGQWTVAAQGGISYAKRAKQWFRSPQGLSVAEVIFGKLPGQGDGDGIFRVGAHFVSPKGAPANYGYLEPMTVRSVGFGMIPVEATVQVSQRRENGFPVPLNTLMRNDSTVIPAHGNEPRRVENHYFSTTIKDSLNVQILSVRVDGLDVGLNGDCRTVEPAPITLSTPDYTTPDGFTEVEWYRTHDPATYWNPLYGGQFSGTMTIPPFTGCTTTAGDDLSDLLTLSASGPDNPIMARNGWPCSFVKDATAAPAPPGISNPKLATESGSYSPGVPYCAGAKPFDYPAREDR
jgi:hypothetical protein